MRTLVALEVPQAIISRDVVACGGDDNNLGWLAGWNGLVLR